MNIVIFNEPPVLILHSNYWKIKIHNALFVDVYTKNSVQFVARVRCTFDEFVNGLPDTLYLMKNHDIGFQQLIEYHNTYNITKIALPYFEI